MLFFYGTNANFPAADLSPQYSRYDNNHPGPFAWGLWLTTSPGEAAYHTYDDESARVIVCELGLSNAARMENEGDYFEEASRLLESGYDTLLRAESESAVFTVRRHAVIGELPGPKERWGELLSRPAWEVRLMLSDPELHLLQWGR